MSYTFTSAEYVQGQDNVVKFNSLAEGSHDSSVWTNFDEENKKVQLKSDQSSNIDKWFSLFVNCHVNVEISAWQLPVSGLSDPFRIQFYIEIYVPTNRKPVLVGTTEF